MSEPNQPPQEETVQHDPLNIATDILFKILMDLEHTVSDFKKMEGTKVLLEYAQATALIDIARSLRTTNTLLDTIAGELERR